MVLFLDDLQHRGRTSGSRSARWLEVRWDTGPLELDVVGAGMLAKSNVAVQRQLSPMAYVDLKSTVTTGGNFEKILTRRRR